LRWTEHAEHIPPMMIPSSGSRATNTWLVDYGPVIEQTMVDLIDWVEHGVDPAATTYEYHDGKVTLPESAAERGGIQPVVRLTVDGSDRADIAVGAEVTLHVRAEMPAGSGTIVSIELDVDGSGSYPIKLEAIDGTQSVVEQELTHRFDQAGTWFVTALAHGHRDGDTATPFRRLPNLDQVRIVVA
jgi:hypothetical protein